MYFLLCSPYSYSHCWWWWCCCCLEFQRERMIAKILFTVISFSFSFNYFITQWFIFRVVHWNKYEWIFWIAFRLYSDAVGVSCSCRNAKWFLIHWSLDQLRRFIGWYHCYDSQSWLAARYPFGSISKQLANNAIIDTHTHTKRDVRRRKSCCAIINNENGLSMSKTKIDIDLE